MYSYYGAISWQILSIYVAADLVLAFVPLLLSPPKISVELFVANETIAILFGGVGVAFWVRYQNLSHRWVHNENWNIEDWISSIEWSRPYRAPHPVPTPHSPIIATLLLTATGLLALMYLVLTTLVFLRS